MAKNKLIGLQQLIIILSFLYFIGAADATFAAESLKVSARTDTSISFHYITNRPDYRKILTLRREGDKLVTPKSELEYNYGTTSYSLKNSKSLGEGNYAFYEFTKEKEVTLNLEGLAPGERYAIDIYTAKSKADDKKGVKDFDRETFTFASLAREPKRQASNIGFSKVTENEMTVSWGDGDGSSAVVFVKQGAAPEKPQDGKTYTASAKYGEEKSRVDNSGTYCIYSGSPKGTNNVTVTNLPSGKYFFATYEFNGNGETANYNVKTGQQNQRSKMTALAPPVITQSVYDNGTLKLAWKPVGNISYYSIDVASDADFKNIIDGLKSVDVGNVTEFEFTEFPETADNTIYVRIKAIGEDASSAFSSPRSITKR